MGGVSADRVSVHIDSIRGDGFNLVGISELGLPGPKATRAARTPTTLTRLYTNLDDKGRSAFSSAPLDVLLRRVENTPAAADDSEIALRRVVSLPQGRTFNGDARVRIDGDDLEKIYDEVAGYSDAVRATSSGVWFDKRQYRASAAADGKSDTGWVPGGASPKGAWWQLTTAPRDITSVDLTQKPTLGDAKRTQWATKVSVLVDGNPDADPTARLWAPAFLGWFVAGMVLAVCAPLVAKWNTWFWLTAAGVAVLVSGLPLAGEPTITPSTASATIVKHLLYLVIAVVYLALASALRLLLHGVAQAAFPRLRKLKTPL